MGAAPAIGDDVPTTEPEGRPMFAASAAQDRAPWYVDALNKYGVPSAAMAVLLYFLIFTVSEGQRTIIANQANEMKAVQANTAALAAMMEAMARHHQSAIANTRFLGAMCFNSARTEQERQRCQDAAFK